MIIANPRWISRRHHNPAAALRLFCLPYGGGGTQIFAEWPALLGPELEIVPVLLPGREERIGEPAATRMDELIPALADGLAEQLPDRPFALLGHSMGGLIAFQLACQLALVGLPAPVHLFLSGCGPVADPDRRQQHKLTDAELIDSLKRTNGTPSEFFESQDLVDLLLPTIRADFALAETFSVRADDSLPVPITAFAGRRDLSAGPDEVRSWRRHTTAEFSLHTMPGGHFFIHDCPRMLGLIAADLRRYYAMT